MPGTVTAVQIANSALMKLGGDRISALTQATKSAQLISAGYDLWRDEVLRGHPWKFALTRAQLAPNATTPAFEYDFTYDLPNDHLRTWTVADENDDDDIPWTEEAGTILANENPLNVGYVRSGTDESVWDTMFCEAFAWKIAANIGYALTQSSSVVQVALQRYDKLLAEARSVSGMSGITKGITADRWTNSRRGSRSRTF